MSERKGKYTRNTETQFLFTIFLLYPLFFLPFFQRQVFITRSSPITQSINVVRFPKCARSKKGFLKNVNTSNSYSKIIYKQKTDLDSGCVGDLFFSHERQNHTFVKHQRLFLTQIICLRQYIPQLIFLSFSFLVKLTGLVLFNVYYF